jgi:hypothetical protein
VTRSESVDDTNEVDDDPANEPAMPRRSRRNGGDDANDASQPTKATDGSLVGDDDAEEVTRCICQSSEYPGAGHRLVTAAGRDGR